MKVLSQGNPPTITEIIIGSGELWTPYKDLKSVIKRALDDTSPESMDEVKQMLTVHKPDFISLLSWKGCNAADRQELRNAGGEGAYFKGTEGKQILSPQLISETILLSDMFNINEFLALDLLATAEAELDKHAGWGRGLLAVYLYYEGRNCLVQSLLTILQAIPGINWLSKVSPKVLELFKNVFDVVFTGDMMDRLLENFEKTSEKAAMEILESNLALGDWRHRTQVVELLQNIRQGLAEIIFYWSANHRILWKDTLRLLDYLKINVSLQQETELKKDDVLILTSFLQCVENNITATEIDETFVKGFKKYIKDNESAVGFRHPELLDYYRMGFYTKVYKVYARTQAGDQRGLNPSILEGKSILLQEDDDCEIKLDVFAFLKRYIVLYPKRYCDNELLMKQLHILFTDFICYMSMKIKDLKNRSEDAAKTAILYYEQGILRPSNLPQDYENFLECLGIFYSYDTYELGWDFFNPHPSCATLNKFVHTAYCDPSSMFVPNAKMFAGLSRSHPDGVFAVLKQPGHNMSIEHFFKSMAKYLNSFGMELGYDGQFIQRLEINTSKPSMNPMEITSICYYLDILENMCKGSDAAKHFFCSTNFSWLQLCFQMGQIRTVPTEIRAKMITVAASMVPSRSPEMIANLWDVFYKMRYIDQGTSDIKSQLEDRESRDTVYPMTIAHLKLLKALVEARFPLRDHNSHNRLENDFRVVFDNGDFEPYVAYLCDSILLKLSHRLYKNIEERWTIATLAISIISNLLDVIPSLMFQLLCDSPLSRSCLTTIHDCILVREMTTGPIPYVDECSWQCLSLILRALQRQSWFMYNRNALPNKDGIVMIGLNEMIIKTISSSGRAEFLITIIKFIDHLLPQQHRHAALEILSLLVGKNGDTDEYVYTALVYAHPTDVIFRQTVTQQLYDPLCEDSFKTLILQLLQKSITHSAPNVALFLLGADKKVEFQNPGVENHPVTLLQALVDNCIELPEAFSTFLILVEDPVLWLPLMKYLRSNHFFTKVLSSNFPNSGTPLESMGQFLKFVAVELKTSPNACALAVKLLERRNCRFQDILLRIEVENQTMTLPILEFFDPSHVSKAIETCEEHNNELNTKLVRVEMLDSLLGGQIRELENNAVPLRRSIHLEAREIIKFALQLNQMRTIVAGQMLLFEGWRQCLETIVLSPSILQAVGIDFLTSMLRVLLNKIMDYAAPAKLFLRMCAETIVTLCSVVKQLKSEMNPTTVQVILHHICNWVNREQYFPIRALLYASIFHLITLFNDENITAYGQSLLLIMTILCKDTFQPQEFGRMQAMNLVAEILPLIAIKGIDVEDAAYLYRSALDVSFTMAKINAVNAAKWEEAATEKDLNSSLNVNRAGKSEKSFSESRLHDSTAEDENASFISNPSASIKAPYVQTTILNHIIQKSYIRKLVDDLSVVDDPQLMQLYTSQPEKSHMRALYAFEVKISLLCRLAAAGTRAINFLLDENVVNKLTDMNVFSLNPSSDVGSHNMHYVNSRVNFSVGAHFSMNNPEMLSRIDVNHTDFLLSIVLKLFHVMLTAAPKNHILLTQIWHFLSTHDVVIAAILNWQSKERVTQTTLSLVTSLMAKIAPRLPPTAVNKKQAIYSKMVQLLHMYGKEECVSEFTTRLVRNVFTFLSGHSRNKEKTKEERDDIFTRTPCKVVLLPTTQPFDYQSHPHEDISFGVVLSIVNLAAIKVCALQSLNCTSKHLADLIAVVESGISLIFFHAEIFLSKNYTDFLSCDQDAKKVKEDMAYKAASTARHISDNLVKFIPNPVFLETLVLRLRRLQLV